MIEIKPVDLSGGRCVWTLHIDFAEKGLDIVNETFNTVKEALDFAKDWTASEVNL